MPGRLKMKCAISAVGYAKDGYWWDLPETTFGQKFSSARNQTLFSTYFLLSPQKFFNLLYSISKIALPRYSRVLNKVEWMSRRSCFWLAANFIFPAEPLWRGKTL